MLFPMTRWAFLTVTLVGLGMVTPAAADDIADCSQSANDDLRIRGCTSLIQQGSADAVSYYGRGLALYNLGDFRRAVADYETYIERDPENTAAYYSRGLALSKLGEFDRAIADFEIYIARDSENADAYYSRGLSLPSFNVSLGAVTMLPS